MWLEVGNTEVRVVRNTPDELAWLLSYLAFPDARWKGGRPPDGATTSMFNVLSKKFPRGFLNLVRKDAPAEGLDVQLIDKRVPPCEPDDDADLEWLRHHPALPPEQEITHQLEAVERVVLESAGILHLPTGAGKTEIAIGLTRRLPCRWLFLVHRSGLLRQAAKRYKKRTGLTAAVAGDEEWNATGAEPLTVATFQTVYARMQKTWTPRPNGNGGRFLLEKDPALAALLTGAQGLIVDECHTLPAGSFWQVAMATKNTYYRVGMSGTPLARGDRRSVLAVGALGPVIYRVKARTLIDIGILAEPRIQMVPLVQPSKRKTWPGVYRECVVRSTARNNLLVQMARLAGKPALLFVREVQHGQRLEALLRKAGISTEFVFGNDSTAERDAAVERLVHGDIEVLVCSVVFQEGVDIPELRSIIVGSAGASVIAALQRVGRGTRALGDKDTVEVWDVLDQGHRYLAEHAGTRKRSYLKEGYSVSVGPL